MNPNAAEKQIEANLRAIEEARRVRKEIRETLRDSRQKTERALEELRRAGYLR
jgi:hypothetical protein